jgi:hypothetical protein
MFITSGEFHVSPDPNLFGSIATRNAKARALLGVGRQTYSAHYTSHTAKVMAHCTVGYLFEDDVENGGKGFLNRL